MPKTFAKAPKPASIEAYERGGIGHDTKSTHKAPETTKRLSLDLPVSLHHRFKVACTNANLTMVAEALALIERRTSELERR